MAQYVTIRVLDVKSKDNTHFKLRLDQKLGVMFREYSRRRDNLAYSFLLDGDVIDAEHTARLLVLRDQDVIVAEEKPGRVRYGSLCGNQILAPHAWRGGPRYRHDVVPVTASARWRGGSRRSPHNPNSLVDIHTESHCKRTATLAPPLRRSIRPVRQRAPPRQARLRRALPPRQGTPWKIPEVSLRNLRPTATVRPLPVARVSLRATLRKTCLPRWRTRWTMTAMATPRRVRCGARLLLRLPRALRKPSAPPLSTFWGRRLRGFLAAQDRQAASSLCRALRSQRPAPMSPRCSSRTAPSRCVRSSPAAALRACASRLPRRRTVRWSLVRQRLAARESPSRTSSPRCRHLHGRRRAPPIALAARRCRRPRLRPAAAPARQPRVRRAQRAVVRRLPAAGRRRHVQRP